MRHTNNNLLCTEINKSINASFKAWDECLTTVKTESLHGIKFRAEECTPVMSPGKTVKELALLFLRHLLELETFEVISDPVADLTIWNVHEFNTNFMAVSLFVGTDKIT